MGTRSVSRSRAQLWRLAEEVVQCRFEGVRPWTWQLDLLRLQRGVQREISHLKATSGESEELQAWQGIRYHARHLGDAFAWMMLAGDKSTISWLNRNGPVPIAPDELDTDKATLAIIEELMRGGWGLALLHDITSWLRIGDVTFIDPDRSEHPFRTVELKATVTRRDSAGATTFHVNVIEAWHESLGERDDPRWHPHLPINGEAVRELAEDESATNHVGKNRKPDRRIERQGQRMTMALAGMLAKNEEVTKLPDDTHLISVRTDLGANAWPQIRKMVQAARRTGYADLLLDDAVLYAAIYDPLTLSKESLENSMLAEALLASGILRGPCIGPSSLVVSATPPSPDREAPIGRPYYCLDAPKSWLRDMLYGRLVIVSVYSPGRFAFEASRSSGYALHHEPERDGPGDFHLEIPTTIDGHDSFINIPGIGRYIHEVVGDLRGVSDFIAHIGPIVRASALIVP